MAVPPAAAAPTELLAAVAVGLLKWLFLMPNPSVLEKLAGNRTLSMAKSLLKTSCTSS